MPASGAIFSRIAPRELLGNEPKNSSTHVHSGALEQKHVHAARLRRTVWKVDHAWRTSAGERRTADGSVPLLQRSVVSSTGVPRAALVPSAAAASSCCAKSTMHFCTVAQFRGLVTASLVAQTIRPSQRDPASTHLCLVKVFLCHPRNVEAHWHERQLCKRLRRFCASAGCVLLEIRVPRSAHAILLFKRCREAHFQVLWQLLQVLSQRFHQLCAQRCRQLLMQAADVCLRHSATGFRWAAGRTALRQVHTITSRSCPRAKTTRSTFHSVCDSAAHDIPGS